MKIQQHDGVVVDTAMIAAGLRRASARGRGGVWGEGGARDLGVAALPPPSLYRGVGGAALGDESPRGAAAKGFPPKPSGGRRP